MTTDDAQRGEPLSDETLREYATLIEGVAPDVLRRIQAGGGLAKYVDSFHALYVAAWYIACGQVDEDCQRRCVEATLAANPFIPEI